MSKYRCTVCNYVYDEEKSGQKFDNLPQSWICPVCGAPKSAFMLLTEVETEKKSGTTVSDVFVSQIEAWGVKHVFGIPGTSTLGVVDAIRKNEKVKYIQVRHEEVAAFMASAHGKLTGGIAACLGVSGPGASNLSTGLHDADLDRSPVIALTGMVARPLIGTGAPQEIDQYSFFRPVTVYDKVLMSENETLTLATNAVKHALVLRGVSHIGIPNDVQKLPYEAGVLSFEGRMPNMSFAQSDVIIAKAVKAINDAERPVIVAGFGSLGHGEKLLELAKKITAPIVSTFRAKDITGDDEPLYVGCHGSIGSTAASELVKKSDLMIVVGSSFSGLTLLPEKRTVQIDIDPMMIAKKYPVVAGLVGNASNLIPLLRQRVKERGDEDYRDEISKLKQEWLKMIESEADPKKKPIRPPYIMKVLNEKLAPDAVISLDVGENCWWFGRNFQMKKTQKMVMSGLLGSMGFGLPGAMAASLAYPDRQVVAIVGDGGFSMVMADFMTVMKYEMPIKVFVLNNGELGMIMQEQKVEGYPNWQTELYNCDFAKYAESCGGAGFKVTDPKELPGIVDEALSEKKAVVVDIDTDPKRFD